MKIQFKKVAQINIKACYCVWLFGQIARKPSQENAVPEFLLFSVVVGLPYHSSS